MVKKIKVLGISNVEAKVITENTGIIGYSIEFGTGDNKQNQSMKCVCTSTWIKQNNNWVCGLHTEIELSQ